MRLSKTKIEKLKKTIKEKKPKGFQKGNTVGIGNKKNKTSYDAEQLLLKKIDNTTIVNYLTLNSHLTENQLEQRLKDPTISSLEKGIVKQFLEISKHGSMGSLQFVLERLVGKPKQEIELSKKDPLKDLSQEELLEMKREIEIQNRKTMQYLEANHPQVQRNIQLYDEQLRKSAKPNKPESEETN